MKLTLQLVTDFDRNGGMRTGTNGSDTAPEPSIEC